jgi:RNA recognition motif-containing protein
MSRGEYSAGKRMRDTAKAKKRDEKARRREARKARGPEEPSLADVAEITGPLPSVEEAMARMATRSSGSRAASIPCRLFVGSLDGRTTEAGLRAAFAAFGEVSDAVIMCDRATGRPRGFGFVTMQSRKDAAKAVAALNGSELDGSVLVVNVATERR